MTFPKLRKVIGSNIRYLRKELDLSLSELADFAGFTYSYLGAVERGERGVTPKTLLRLSEIFCVPISRLCEERPTDKVPLKDINAKRKNKLAKISLHVKCMSDAEMNFLTGRFKHLREIKAAGEDNQP